MQSGDFTDKAKKALSLAEKAASKVHAGYVGTEHLLVGLLKEKTGVAARVLEENGANEGKLIEMIAELAVPEAGIVLKEREGYSPRAREVLEEAHKQAERFREELTGTEHILLALLKQGESVAIRMITTQGMSIQKLYTDTLVAMGESSSLYKEDRKSVV